MPSSQYPSGSGVSYTAADQAEELVGVPVLPQTPPPAQAYPVTDSQTYAAEQPYAPVEGGVNYGSQSQPATLPAAPAEQAPATTTTDAASGYAPAGQQEVAASADPNYQQYPTLTAPVEPGYYAGASAPVEAGAPYPGLEPQPALSTLSPRTNTPSAANYPAQEYQYQSALNQGSLRVPQGARDMLVGEAATDPLQRAYLDQSIRDEVAQRPIGSGLDGGPTYDDAIMGVSDAIYGAMPEGAVKDYFTLDPNLPEGTVGTDEMANIWGGFGPGSALRGEAARRAALAEADAALAARAARGTGGSRGTILDLGDTPPPDVGLVDANGNPLRSTPHVEPTVPRESTIRWIDLMSDAPKPSAPGAGGSRATPIEVPPAAAAAAQLTPDQIAAQQAIGAGFNQGAGNALRTGVGGLARAVDEAPNARRWLATLAGAGGLAAGIASDTIDFLPETTADAPAPAVGTTDQLRRWDAQMAENRTVRPQPLPDTPPVGIGPRPALKQPSPDEVLPVLTVGEGGQLKISGESRMSDLWGGVPTNDQGEASGTAREILQEGYLLPRDPETGEMIHTAGLPQKDDNGNLVIKDAYIGPEAVRAANQQGNGIGWLDDTELQRLVDDGDITAGDAELLRGKVIVAPKEWTEKLGWPTSGDPAGTESETTFEEVWEPAAVEADDGYDGYTKKPYFPRRSYGGYNRNSGYRGSSGYRGGYRGGGGGWRGGGGSYGGGGGGGGFDFASMGLGPDFMDGFMEGFMSGGGGGDASQILSEMFGDDFMSSSGTTGRKLSRSRSRRKGSKRTRTGSRPSSGMKKAKPGGTNAAGKANMDRVNAMRDNS